MGLDQPYPDRGRRAVVSVVKQLKAHHKVTKNTKVFFAVSHDLLSKSRAFVVNFQ